MDELTALVAVVLVVISVSGIDTSGIALIILSGILEGDYSFEKTVKEPVTTSAASECNSGFNKSSKIHQLQQISEKSKSIIEGRLAKYLPPKAKSCWHIIGLIIVSLTLNLFKKTTSTRISLTSRAKKNKYKLHRLSTQLQQLSPPILKNVHCTLFSKILLESRNAQVIWNS